MDVKVNQSRYGDRNSSDPGEDVAPATTGQILKRYRRFGVWILPVLLAIGVLSPLYVLGSSPSRVATRAAPALQPGPASTPEVTMSPNRAAFYLTAVFVLATLLVGVAADAWMRRATTDKGPYRPDLKVWGVGLMTGAGAVLTYLFVGLVLRWPEVRTVTSSVALWSYLAPLITVAVALIAVLWTATRLVRQDY